MANQLIHRGTETVPQAGDRIILNLGLKHAFFVRDGDPMMYRDDKGRVQSGKMAFDPPKGSDLEHAARFLEELGCPPDVGLYRVPYSDPNISVFDLVRGGRRG